jgi:hypothetical protein
MRRDGVLDDRRRIRYLGTVAAEGLVRRIGGDGVHYSLIAPNVK